MFAPLWGATCVVSHPIGAVGGLLLLLCSVGGVAWFGSPAHHHPVHVQALANNSTITAPIPVHDSSVSPSTSLVVSISQTSVDCSELVLAQTHATDVEAGGGHASVASAA